LKQGLRLEDFSPTFEWLIKITLKQGGKDMVNHIRRGLVFDKIRENHGFMDEKILDMLVVEDRLCPVLVRCGCGRFTCPAQDAKHFIDIIRKEKSDYIRDVSLPTSVKY